MSAPLGSIGNFRTNRPRLSYLILYRATMVYISQYHGSVHNMKYAVAFRCKVFVPGSCEFLFLNFPRVRLAKIIVSSPPESSLLSIKPLVRRLLKLECFDFVCLHFPKLPRACIPRYTHTNHEPILKVVK